MGAESAVEATDDDEDGADGEEGAGAPLLGGGGQVVDTQADPVRLSRSCSFQIMQLSHDYTIQHGQSSEDAMAAADRVYETMRAGSPDFSRDGRYSERIAALEGDDENEVHGRTHTGGDSGEGADECEGGQNIEGEGGIVQLVEQSPYPWQTTLFDLLKRNANDRKKLWVYSILYRKGKSFTVKYLQATMGALLVKGSFETKAVQETLAKRHRTALAAADDGEEDPYLKKPVIILELGREESIRNPPSLYKIIEMVTDGFDHKICNVKWERWPHIIVFANRPPTNPSFRDRFDVHTIDPGTMELLEDKYYSPVGDASGFRRQCLSDVTIQSIRDGVQIDRDAAADALLFQRRFRVEGNEKLEVKAIAEELAKWGFMSAGFDGKEKLNNRHNQNLMTWIEEQYADDISVGRLKRSPKKYGKAAWWQGFQMLPPPV